MPTLFLGDDIVVRSEVDFLKVLWQHLKQHQDDAILLANFTADKRRSSRQIDFLLVVPRVCVWQIELKFFKDPLKGEENGKWKLKQDGKWKQISELNNPWKQALECKQAIAKDIERFAKEERHDPVCKQWLDTLESCACFYPRLHPESEVPGRDPEELKAHVLGYDEFLGKYLKRKRDPGWTHKHWLEFADWKHLRRHDERDELGSSKISRLLDQYTEGFKNVHGLGLHPLTPVTIEHQGEERSSESCWDLIRDREYTHFVGPSGCGKTHHLTHMALRAIEENSIPIMVKARDYEGDLRQLLDRGVSWTHHSSNEILNAASTAKVPLLLIVDGLNECPRSPTGLKTRLLQDIEAIRAKHGNTRVLISSQARSDVPSQKDDAVIVFQPLDESQKCALLSSYAGADLTPRQLETASAFVSAHDLALAASVVQELGASPTRASLYQTWIRSRCEKPSQYLFVRSSLAAIAGKMRLTFRDTLDYDTILRIISETVREHGAAPKGVDLVFQTGALITSGKGYAFKHELLQSFFEAVRLVDDETRHETAASALEKSENLDICDFVIELQDEKDGLLSCLDAVGKVNLKRAAVIAVRCLKGELGPVRQATIEGEVLKVIARARKELVVCEIVSGSRRVSYYPYNYNNLLSRTVRDEYIIATSRSGLWARRCLNTLIDLSDAADSALKSAVIGTPDANVSDLGTVPDGYEDLPGLMAADVLRVALTNFDGPLTDDARTWVRERLREPQAMSGSEMELCWCLISGSVGEYEAVIPSLLEASLGSKVSSLRHHALRCVGRWRVELGEDAITRIQSVLTDFCASEPRHTFYLYHLRGLYEIPAIPGLSAEDALGELMEYRRRVLSPEEKPDLADLICGLCDRHSVGLVPLINLAPESDRLGFLKWVFGFTPDWGRVALMDLFTEHLNDPEVQQILIEVACTPCGDGEREDSRDVVVAKAWAMSAMFLEQPPARRGAYSDGEMAWHLFGELIFWAAKGHDVDEECGKVWRELREKYAYEAIEPFFCLSRVILNKWPIGTSRNEVRHLLEFGLKYVSDLSCLPCAYSSEEQRPYLVRFMIEQLGEVGDERSTEVLRPYLDDPQWAELARNTLRKIHAQE